MKRLIEKTVFCGLVTDWRLAGAPTRRWSSLVKATTDGVVRPPSAFGITVGSPPSSTAMQEFVVPRSMPMVFAIEWCSFLESDQSENLSLNISHSVIDDSRAFVESYDRSRHLWKEQGDGQAQGQHLDVTRRLRRRSRPEREGSARDRRRAAARVGDPAQGIPRDAWQGGRRGQR